MIEDLHHTIVVMKENDVELIAAVIRSPFNLEIQEARLPEGFILPVIKAYEGKSPQDHLNHFNDFMELHFVSKLAKCRVFTVTLIAGAKK